MLRRRWTYWRDDESIECAAWAGGAVPSLGAHFHAEDQLTLILAGSRVFRIRDEQIRVEAGECLHIPARIVHRSLPSADDDVRCLNIYASLPAVGPT
ncbi:cupin domain-containing protein, partial [Rhizobiaceae sp. 2RAB30]